jgi:CBS domain-containing protein
VEQMQALGLRRLPVLDRSKRLVGILSLPYAAPHQA